MDRLWSDATKRIGTKATGVKNKICLGDHRNVAPDWGFE
jgi:hypothetical protein